MLEHGGRLHAAAARYGIARERWLDLSTGINPNGWPLPPIPRTQWTRLPDDDDGLEAIAAQYYGAAQVLAVAGSQAAIQMLPRLRAASRVGVIAPGYAEHGQAWSRAGHHVDYRDGAYLLAHVDDYDVLVLIHPNNPGGDCFDPATLLQAHARLRARGGWLVIDEAFMDATPQTSLCACSDREGLIVLRSVGKFFGLAGARAGFVAADATLLARLRAELGPWTVATPTRWLLCQAFADTAWQQQAREQLAQDSQRLHALLHTHGLVAAGSTAFFQWVRTPHAATLHHALAQHAILTRLFTQPASLRLGLPGDASRWQRLHDALSRCAGTIREIRRDD